MFKILTNYVVDKHANTVAMDSILRQENSELHHTNNVYCQLIDVLTHKLKLLAVSVAN